MSAFFHVIDITAIRQKQVYGTACPPGNVFPDTNRGILFSVNRDGTTFTVLHNFGNRLEPGPGLQSVSAPSDGWDPNDLIEGPDGWLYGTTRRGGPAITGGWGIVFKIRKNGSGYSILHPFQGHLPRFALFDGANPNSGLILGSDGWLYGTTEEGGSFDVGTVFKIGQEGNGYSVLHSFTGKSNGGSYPVGGVTEGSDGFLYGTTYSAPPPQSNEQPGTVFRVRRDGTQFEVIATVDYPGSALVEGPGGLLYGFVQSQVGWKIVAFSKSGTVLGQTSLFPVVDQTLKLPVPEPILERPDRLGKLTKASDGRLYGTFHRGLDEIGFLFALSWKTGFELSVLDRNVLRLTCSGIPGELYAIQATRFLPVMPGSTVWETVGQERAGENSRFTFSAPLPSLPKSRIYRLVKQ